jgi:hypothetical protein
MGGYASSGAVGTIVEAAKARTEPVTPDNGTVGGIIGRTLHDARGLVAHFLDQNPLLRDPTPLNASRWFMDHSESPITTTNAISTGTVGQLGLHESAEPLPQLFIERFPDLTIASAEAMKEVGGGEPARLIHRAPLTLFR